jgi:hypothetical protein
VVGWTPTVDGPRGLARWRNDSVATAMLKTCDEAFRMVVRVVERLVEADQVLRPRRRWLLFGFAVGAKNSSPDRAKIRNVKIGASVTSPMNK